MVTGLAGQSVRGRGAGRGAECGEARQHEVARAGSRGGNDACVFQGGFFDSTTTSGAVTVPLLRGTNFSVIGPLGHGPRSEVIDHHAQDWRRPLRTGRRAGRAVRAHRCRGGSAPRVMSAAVACQPVVGNRAQRRLARRVRARAGWRSGPAYRDRRRRRRARPHAPAAGATHGLRQARTRAPVSLTQRVAGDGESAEGLGCGSSRFNSSATRLIRKLPSDTPLSPGWQLLIE